MSGKVPVSVRDARDADVARITAIYRGHVVSGTATFELEPPDEAEIARRLRAVRDAGLPWLVAEIDGTVAGYAYAGPYRPRPAYRFTAETSVYVAPEQHRRGAGRALLGALVAACERAGRRQLVAIIGDSGHAASIALHRALGFRDVGTLRDVGWKHGRWLDTVLMQREIGAGASAPGLRAGESA